MAVMRAARAAAAFGCLVLTFGGNLWDILVREKGRSTSLELNAVRRKVCVFALGNGISVAGWRV
eukprot:481182-Lingulodinium_polyedra.AAC.1